MRLRRENAGTLVLGLVKALVSMDHALTLHEAFALDGRLEGPADGRPHVSGGVVLLGWRFPPRFDGRADEIGEQTERPGGAASSPSLGRASREASPSTPKSSRGGCVCVRWRSSCRHRHSAGFWVPAGDGSRGQTPNNLITVRPDDVTWPPELCYRNRTVHFQARKN